MKRRRSSKTYWFGTAIALLGAGQEYLPGLQQAIPAAWYPWIFAGIGVAVMVLREFTTDAVRPPKPPKGWN